MVAVVCFVNDTATTEIYTYLHTLSLHDALPIWAHSSGDAPSRIFEPSETFRSRNMAEITAAAVKELRDRSGAGMLACKKALTEANGDIEAATDWLRAKGLAAAQTKTSRPAADGLAGDRQSHGLNPSHTCPT